MKMKTTKAQLQQIIEEELKLAMGAPQDIDYAALSSQAVEAYKSSLSKLGVESDQPLTEPEAKNIISKFMQDPRSDELKQQIDQLMIGGKISLGAGLLTSISTAIAQVAFDAQLTPEAMQFIAPLAENLPITPMMTVDLVLGTAAAAITGALLAWDYASKPPRREKPDWMREGKVVKTQIQQIIKEELKAVLGSA